MMEREIARTKNFVDDAAAFILDLGRKALVLRGEFRLALSGGNTPRPVYQKIAAAAADFPWDKAIVGFSDERCVPPDDSQSNYRMARETLLQPANVPDKSILRMQGEIDPETAARQYEDQLRALAKKGGEEIYRHDLILLGLGEDGHTASLFPETKALNEFDRLVMANFVSKLNSWRLTFTFSLINGARDVCFLVNASKHADLIERVLDGDPAFPASRVKPKQGKVTWIIGQS